MLTRVKIFSSYLLHRIHVQLINLRLYLCVWLNTSENSESDFNWYRNISIEMAQGIFRWLKSSHFVQEARHLKNLRKLLRKYLTLYELIFLSPSHLTHRSICANCLLLKLKTLFYGRYLGICYRYRWTNSNASRRLSALFPDVGTTSLPVYNFSRGLLW